MNTQDFTYLLHHPKSISKEQTEQLENIITSFPYFQSAKALYLKGLKNQDSFKYNQALKTTAAYTTDRSILFNFITSSFFIDDDNSQKQIEIINSLSKKEDKSLSKPSPEVLEIGKPLDFDKNESHSFNEWLQIGTLKPIDRKKTDKKVKFDIIDKFIASKPKIKPVKEATQFNNIEEETTDYKSLMTETLAQVYLEQKKYENAKKAYRILSLKYPEKSSFFANRIKAIENLENK